MRKETPSGRSIARISTGDALTLAYCDPYERLSERGPQLQRCFFFECKSVSLSFQCSCASVFAATACRSRGATDDEAGRRRLEVGGARTV